MTGFPEVKNIMVTFFGKSTHRVSSAHGSCMVVCNAWGGEPSFLAEEAASMNGGAAAGRGCGGSAADSPKMLTKLFSSQPVEKAASTKQQFFSVFP